MRFTSQWGFVYDQVKRFYKPAISWNFVTCFKFNNISWYKVVGTDLAFMTLPQHLGLWCPKCHSELIARSALLSMKNPNPTVINTTEKIAIDSRTLSKKYDSTEAVNNKIMGKFLNWRKRICAVERCSTSGMTLRPYLCCLAFTSLEERPFSSLDSSFETTPEADTECQLRDDGSSSKTDNFLMV